MSACTTQGLQCNAFLRIHLCFCPSYALVSGTTKVHSVVTEQIETSSKHNNTLRERPWVGVEIAVCSDDEVLSGFVVCINDWEKMGCNAAQAYSLLVPGAQQVHTVALYLETPRGDGCTE